MAGQRFQFGPFVLDMQRETLVRGGQGIAVGHKGLALLHALLRAPTRPLSKAELMEAAWPGIVVEKSNLSVQIAALRKLLGPQLDGREWITLRPNPDLWRRFSRMRCREIESFRGHFRQCSSYLAAAYDKSVPHANDRLRQVDLGLRLSYTARTK